MSGPEGVSRSWLVEATDWVCQVPSRPLVRVSLRFLSSHRLAFSRDLAAGGASQRAPAVAVRVGRFGHAPGASGIPDARGIPGTRGVIPLSRIDEVATERMAVGFAPRVWGAVGSFIGIPRARV